MLIARTPVPLPAPCNGSFLLTADTSRLAATRAVNNAQAQRHANGTRPRPGYRGHPQWPRRRASHILGDLAPGRGHPGRPRPLDRHSRGLSRWPRRPAAPAAQIFVTATPPDDRNVGCPAPDARNICHTRKHGHHPARTWHGAARIWKAVHVSPQSRRREPPGGPGHPGHGKGIRLGDPRARRRPTRSSPRCCAPPANCWPCAARWTPNSWSASCSAPGGASAAPRSAGAADVEELVGEGLVSYAAQQRSPAALALLSGIACLGTPRQAMQAEAAALALIERGVVRPPWAEHVGAVTAGDCYVNSDLFGDRDEVVCVFSYAGRGAARAGHGGGLQRGRDAPRRLGDLPGGPAAGALPGGQRGDAGQPARATFSQVEPPQARRLLETALAVTEAATGPPPSESFASYHAFIRARIRTLPPARPGHGAERATPAGRPGPVGPPATAPAGAGRPPGGTPGPGTAGPCWSPSSSPRTRPRTCRTPRRPAAARTTSSTTAATTTSGGRCG